MFHDGSTIGLHVSPVHIRINPQSCWHSCVSIVWDPNTDLQLKGKTNQPSSQHKYSYPTHAHYDYVMLNRLVFSCQSLTAGGPAHVDGCLLPRCPTVIPPKNVTVNQCYHAHAIFNLIILRYYR